jgi:hypothetical protein
MTGNYLKLPAQKDNFTCSNHPTHPTITTFSVEHRISCKPDLSWKNVPLVLKHFYVTGFLNKPLSTGTKMGCDKTQIFYKTKTNDEPELLTLY